jgi:catechol 2,3-dioxygenase-like lactoylglutathione lyase family enzyme
VTQRIAAVTLVVADYDEAIDYYCRVLGFELVEDTPLEGGKRWVLVRPPRSSGSALLLARAASDAQRARVGDQTGGRVFLFLHTDDFAADHARYVAAGVRFVEPPRSEPYGTVAVFEDPFGNRWDLLEPARQPRSSGAVRHVGPPSPLSESSEPS